MPDILYEDNHLLAVNKRSGDLSQPDAADDTALQGIISDFIKKRDSKPGNVYVGTLHRLDRLVSGVLLFAKTSKAAGRVSELIRNRNFDKFYLALTPRSSSLTHDWIQFSDSLYRDVDITRVSEKKESGTDATLYIKALENGKKYTLSLIKLETGRKHQIRAQLSSRSLPILGDKKYGSSVNIPEGIALHACFLSFVHPVKKDIVNIYAPFPAIITDILKSDGISVPDKESITRECASFLKNIGH